MTSIFFFARISLSIEKFASTITISHRLHRPHSPMEPSPPCLPFLFSTHHPLTPSRSLIMIDLCTRAAALTDVLFPGLSFMLPSGQFHFFHSNSAPCQCLQPAPTITITKYFYIRSQFTKKNIHSSLKSIFFKSDGTLDQSRNSIR